MDILGKNSHKLTKILCRKKLNLRELSQPLSQFLEVEVLEHKMGVRLKKKNCESYFYLFLPSPLPKIRFVFIFHLIRPKNVHTNNNNNNIFLILHTKYSRNYKVSVTLSGYI